MCLAIPGKVVSIDLSVPQMAMAKVDFGGIVKDICVQWVDVKTGDYILAHAGLGIAVIDQACAIDTINDLNAMAGSLDNLQ
ncbi:MAG: HypC/HybG/HupF family hydrogenase formation chaperone [Tannerellaceae bacterium]|nr:HypC/HybG/HupF family hydrogenase formation chaperone [Tannerellaceae bacterium]